jgi:hypothetical protein
MLRANRSKRELRLDQQLIQSKGSENVGILVM